MKYTELIESCKKAIEKGYCGGCQGLEQEDYRRKSKLPIQDTFCTRKYKKYIQEFRS